MSEQVKGLVYTDHENVFVPMRVIFDAIKHRQLDYQWLMTNVICYPENEQFSKFFQSQVIWISGEELEKIVLKEDFKWAWAYMSGFPKGTTVDEVLQYDLPFADHQRVGWKPQLHIQHPLAEIEIVPWDGNRVIVLAKNPKVIDDFRAYFPTAEELR